MGILLFGLIWSGASAIAATTVAVAGLADRDRNGVEDLLDGWFHQERSWQELRQAARSQGAGEEDSKSFWPPSLTVPADGPWTRDNLRVICLGHTAASLTEERERVTGGGGVCKVIHSLDRFGGVTVLEVDQLGLRALVAGWPGGTLLLDRDGRPALSESRGQVGVESLRGEPWLLDGDWTATVAILDSGCDTAHDDLGDYSHDNIDGPPPAVGDALDWFPATSAWPAFEGYRVVGWHDVTDDFPEAAGPWDYHYHGTALASVVAGEGEVDPSLSGLAPGARLTIVKYYDFDSVWHQWLGDFLAACDWVLDQREIQRIRVVLAAVNWDVDAGISAAMSNLAAVGILPVVAAGNEGGSGDTAGYPALSPAALTAGGVNDAGAVAAFSGRGPLAGDKPDLMAPSGGLQSTAGRIIVGDNEPNDTYSARYGTSLAAAHVAAGAFILLEALHRIGAPYPEDAEAVAWVAALLRATAAPVLTAETADGQGEIVLPLSFQPDSLRGWGLLQVQGAVEAALLPLAIGESAADSLGENHQRLVLARRLPLLPGTGCQIRATPAPGLDILLEVHNADWLSDPLWGGFPLRRNAGGAGAAETLSYPGAHIGISFVVVKRLAGEGRVAVSISAAEPSQTAYAATVGGIISGWPVSGQLPDSSEPSLVLTSLADIDPFARMIHALDPRGQQLPGWPIVLFLPGSLQGPLSAPLVWNLDGLPGDEIVAGSSFGRVYFVTSSGSVLERAVAATNIKLTAPVAFDDGTGQQLVAVLSSQGSCYRFSGDGTLLGDVPVGESQPLAPAVGQLSLAGGEEMAIACSDGSLHALAASGSGLAGWPLSLGPGSSRAPVLVDFDADGLHEVVVARLSADGTEIVFRVFNGSAAPATADGAVAPAPSTGKWLALSNPGVSGSDSDAPEVVVTALGDNGASGDESAWVFAVVRLDGNGSVLVQAVSEFRPRVATTLGRLQLLWSQMPAPLAWDFHLGGRVEPEVYLALGWEEEISGFPNPQAAAATWYRPAEAGAHLPGWGPLWFLGPSADPITAVGAAVYRDAGGDWVRITCQDRNVMAQWCRGGWGRSAAWGMARGDARNSGAYPLAGDPPTGTPGISAQQPARLELWPNPSPGSVHVQWRGAEPGSATLDVYDLRGRRIKRLASQVVSSGSIFWDGRDATGRPLATGTYLLVLTHARGRLSKRVLLSR